MFFMHFTGAIVQPTAISVVSDQATVVQLVALEPTVPSAAMARYLDSECVLFCYVCYHMLWDYHCK